MYAGFYHRRHGNQRPSERDEHELLGRENGSFVRLLDPIVLSPQKEDYLGIEGMQFAIFVHDDAFMLITFGLAVAAAALACTAMIHRNLQGNCSSVVKL
ncbi:unnamed protein product [Protopolystoma xenopodis]|uniref:Uncharacterized protein n=1 Tax=Protopolystoma xenopodis TaxID=117903 RepID=A0A3S5FGI1_9PLAT|nr:unnamed protein product [Protopolystoma xenopodis]